MIEIQTRDGAIYEALVKNGKSVRMVAREFGIGVDDVNAVLDRTCEKIDDAFRLRMIKVEIARLQQLQSVFHAQAVDGDIAAGALSVRLSERISAMLGLDSPLRIDAVQLMKAVEPQKTSTEEIQAAIDRIVGRSTSTDPDDDGGTPKPN